jgi:hypothetical protein
MTQGYQAVSNSRRIRATPIAEPVPEGIDQDIFEGTAVSPTAMGQNFADGETTSYTLLAACGPNELAMEQGDGGAFTRALLDTMNGLGLDNLTYSDIIQYLPPLAGQVSLFIPFFLRLIFIL